MAYTKTNWVNGYTPLNASNMNKIEEGIYNNDTFLSSLDIRVNTLEGSIGQGGIGSVVVSGNGNALTNASYNSSTKILNFEKNNTFALDSDLDSVNAKNLYHLGVYDSVSGNTITRQTGYLSSDDIVKENIMTDTTFTNTRFYFVVSDIEKSTIIPPFLVKWNLKGDDGSVLSNTNYTSICNYNGTIYIRINDNGDVINNLNDLKKYILSHNVSIQYKLATSYTEEIIEGQPLNTLDQAGSQWVRDEWEKGLNLINNNKLYVGYINGNGDLVNTSSSDTLNTDYILLKAGTYTISSTLPRCQISIYNINKVFQRNISWLIFTFTLDSESYVRIGINDQSQTFSGNNYLATTFKVMLVEGSHAYPYQEYRGGIVRESQLIKVKTFSGDTSTFNDFKSWVDSNNERIISIMYYENASGGHNYYNVIFGSDNSVFKFINNEETLESIRSLSSGSEGADILKIYYI